MKVRQGFVSNSSSSSFLIYGVCMSQSELEERFKSAQLAEGVAEEDIEDEDFDPYEHFPGLSVEQPECSDDVYIGLSWSSVKDDETGAQFKARVLKALKDGGLDVTEKNLATHSEAWFG